MALVHPINQNRENRKYYLPEHRYSDELKSIKWKCGKKMYVEAHLFLEQISDNYADGAVNFPD